MSRVYTRFGDRPAKLLDSDLCGVIRGMMTRPLHGRVELESTRASYVLIQYLRVGRVREREREREAQGGWEGGTETKGRVGEKGGGREGGGG